MKLTASSAAKLCLDPSSGGDPHSFLPNALFFFFSSLEPLSKFVIFLFTVISFSSLCFSLKTRRHSLFLTSARYEPHPTKQHPLIFPGELPRTRILSAPTFHIFSRAVSLNLPFFLLILRTFFVCCRHPAVTLEPLLLPYGMRPSSGSPSIFCLLKTPPPPSLRDPPFPRFLYTADLVGFSPLSFTTLLFFDTSTLLRCPNN